MEHEKIKIMDLLIEVTRRCNMRCVHCLRGDPMDMDLREKDLEELLGNVSDISHVSFTGGEPSLNIPTIRRFYEICWHRGIPVGSFFIATNGFENQKELAQVLMEQYAKSKYQYLCGAAISIDRYHDAARQSEILKTLPFYTDSKEHRWNDTAWVKPIGKALENGINTGKQVLPSDRFDARTLSDGSIMFERICLSANGYIYADCELSIKDEDKMMDGNADDAHMPIRHLRQYIEQIRKTMDGRKEEHERE